MTQHPTAPPTDPPTAPPTATTPTTAGGLASAVYEGVVRHRRLRPRAHELSVGISMLYLDLSELDRVFAGRWLWSVERANVASFRRRDYLGGEGDLAEAARGAVEARLGFRPGGPVRVLTMVRQFGYVFNPVSFYY